MKHIQYLILVVAALLLGSCSSDTTTDPTPGGEARKAFTALSEIGVYQFNTPRFVFDKAAHQLSITPSKRIIRIQSDAGDKYAQLTLSAMPKIGGEGVACSYTNNIGMSNMELEGMELLRQENDLIWLWCEKNQIGMILPWID